MMEGFPEISLSTSVNELEVLCESIVDFENLKLNGLDLTSDVATHGWEVYFNRLKGFVCPKMIQDFWIHAKSTDVQVFSSVQGQEF